MKIENNTATMERDIQLLREQLQQARSHFSQLTDRMHEMNQMWSGPANVTMRQRFQQDAEQIRELCALLEGLINELEAKRHLYETCEWNVSDTIAAISIS